MGVGTTQSSEGLDRTKRWREYRFAVSACIEASISAGAPAGALSVLRLLDSDNIHTVSPDCRAFTLALNYTSRFLVFQPADSSLWGFLVSITT